MSFRCVIISISVIASSNNNGKGYVSIYGYDYDSSGNLKYLNANGNLGNTAVPLYTMFVPNSDNIDTLKYFNYNSTTGKTDTTAVVASDTNSSNKLFAHIFKVPKGKYFIGSPYGSINIYYISLTVNDSEVLTFLNSAMVWNQG